MKTSDLIGPALDWAVDKSECDETFSEIPVTSWLEAHADKYEPQANYSTDWSQGGPIIEREGIAIRQLRNGKWMASHSTEYGFGDEATTPLIAAMRCYVAFKLGEEIDVPKELT